MNVNKWGPGGWEFLHSITFNYPLDPIDTDKENYRIFFKSIENILPCKYCRDSYKIYYKYLPIDPFLDSREGVVYWLYKIHELINQKIFKESTNSSFENVIRKYEDIRAKCGKMVRDGDEDKIYKTCQSKPTLINKEYLQKFLKKAYTYEPIINKMIQNLYTSDENPNKEYLEYLTKNKSYENKTIIYPVIYYKR